MQGRPVSLYAHFFPISFGFWEKVTQQECIPVGFVPPAAVAVMGGPRAGTTPGAGTPQSRHPPWSRHLGQIPLNFPLGCGPGPDPPQLPPWLWAWTRSPSTSPLGVGLDQIPLNFPLGCGPGDPPPPDPPKLPLGCGPRNLQGMLGYHTTPRRPAARHAGIPPAMHAGIAHPPPHGQTHTCKNITFANYVCGR